MLKRLYEKSEIWFAIFWIAAYCVLMSVADSVSLSLGTEKIVTLPVAILLSLALLVFLKKNGLLHTYGFCRPALSFKTMLFYLPMLVLISANFWCGVGLNYSILETILCILAMFCVGFLEEVIFRGLLFGAMTKTNVKSAIIVSSLTFGIGHIINLFNGSGAELVSNILQVIYATAAGFMFVMVYYATRSIISCIITHAAFNAIGVFSLDASASLPVNIIICAAITLISLSYAVYIILITKKIKIKENKK